MQDIGGCRAVVDSMEQLRALENRLKKFRTPISYADYTEHPRQSGYRAVHVVVEYQERAIEVQLRTHPMHAWALAAEAYSACLARPASGRHSSDPVVPRGCLQDHGSPGTG